MRKITLNRMQAFGRNQISVQVSGVRCQQTSNPGTRNLTPETFSAMNQMD